MKRVQGEPEEGNPVPWLRSGARNRIRTMSLPPDRWSWRKRRIKRAAPAAAWFWTNGTDLRVAGITPPQNAWTVTN